MKRSLGLLVATTLLTSGALALGTGSVGAAATTTPVVALVQTTELTKTSGEGFADGYVVHGLNLDGQSEQSEQGTAVTVCVDGDVVLSDLQFGDIAGPLPLPQLGELTVDVYVGADVPCGSTTPVISQTVTVPDALGVALVATAGPSGDLELLPVVLDLSPPLACELSAPLANTVQGALEDDSRLGFAHAAAAPTVTVRVSTSEGSTGGDLDFGEAETIDLPAFVYEVTVLLGDAPIVGPVSIETDPCFLTFVYVVGNQPIGEEPTTTTTAPAPAAQAVAARPAFTG